jgi:5-methyltetrahydrofolate--homocysteine methyltransferase
LKEKGKDPAYNVVATLAGQGGRTLSGQTLMAFSSVQHTNIVSIGLNCSFGAADMKPICGTCKIFPCYVIA